MTLPLAGVSDAKSGEGLIFSNQTLSRPCEMHKRMKGPTLARTAHGGVVTRTKMRLFTSDDRPAHGSHTFASSAPSTETH